MLKKQILHFGQHPNHKNTYEIFVSASGSNGDLFKIRSELEKLLFRTELKNGELLAKFNGEYLVLSNMVRYLDTEE